MKQGGLDFYLQMSICLPTCVAAQQYWKTLRTCVGGVGVVTLLHPVGKQSQADKTLRYVLLPRY